MVGVTKCLKRALGGIIFVYFGAGVAAIAVSSYFLSTPNKRRQIIINSEQVHVALTIGVLMVLASVFFTIGITCQKRGRVSLKLFNFLNVFIMGMTLCLGAYAWFQSLDVQGSYKDRWATWPKSSRTLFQEEGQCCGYENHNDHPAPSGFCSPDNSSHDLIEGCAKSIYTFVIGYLQNVYTALFLFTCVNFVSLMGSLVLLRAQEDQRRYEKSMRKMINLHHIDNNDSPMPDYHTNQAHPHTLSPALPEYNNRVSVLYSAN